MYKLSKKLAAGSVVLAATALGGAGVALADGYVGKGKTVVYERPADWSGVYFGVGSGYQWSSIDVSNDISISSDHDDGFVSAHIGAQHQWGAVVLGIEGSWMSTLRGDDGSTDVCDSVLPSLTNPQIAPGNFCSARLQDIITVGGRIGWAAGHWMPYVTGGYANGGYDLNVRVGGTLIETAHTRLDGWYLGGGFEWQVSPGWTAGLEYKHYEFEDGSTTAHFPAGPALETVRFDASTDSIAARVSWRWGRPEAKPLK
jgi:opacity protein-like surface antigen